MSRERRRQWRRLLEIWKPRYMSPQSLIKLDLVALSISFQTYLPQDESCHFVESVAGVVVVEKGV